MKKLLLIALLVMSMIAFVGCGDDEPEQEDTGANEPVDETPEEEQAEEEQAEEETAVEEEEQDEEQAVADEQEEEDTVEKSAFIHEYNGRYFAAFTLIQAVSTDGEGNETVYKNVSMMGSHYTDFEQESIFDQEMADNESFPVHVVLEVSDPMTRLEDILYGDVEYLQRFETTQTFGFFVTDDDRALIINGGHLDQIGIVHPEGFFEHGGEYPMLDKDVDKSEHYDFKIVNRYIQPNKMYTASLAMISLEDEVFIPVGVTTENVTINY